MIVSEEVENEDNTTFDCPCLCIRRIFCSPNRVTPLTNLGKVDTVDRQADKSFKLVISSAGQTLETESVVTMQPKREKRIRTPLRTTSMSHSSPTPRRTPVQQSQSSHALPAAAEEESKTHSGAPRPTTRVMNRNPTAEEIATLPHISANKTMSDINLSSTKPDTKSSSGFRLGGKIVLPPLRKGAGGDAGKQSLSKHKSMFRKKNELEKSGDNGSGEKVITFSLPAISTMDSIELRNQNPIVRKGGMAYDIIIPSSTSKSHNVGFAGKPFDPIVKKIPETNFESESDLRIKLEKAEKRRLAKQEEMRRLRKEREKAIQQNKEERLDHANEKARDLEARMEKAAEKRQEQLSNRQVASRKRLERVQRHRRKSEGSLDKIETEEMSREDIWKFLVTRGEDPVTEKDIPWWEKNQQNAADKSYPAGDKEDRRNSKIPRFKQTK